MNLKRKLLSAAAAGLLAVSLLAGCGGGGGNSGGSGAPKVETPKTAPTMTFKFGSHEAKVYELTGVDLRNNINTWELGVLGNDVYFQCGRKPPHMGKVTMKGETISDFTDLGETDDNHTIAMNDKVVLWKGPKDALVVYDGKTTKVGGKWPGQLLAKVGGGISGREEFYFLGGKKLKMGKLKDGSIKDVQEIIPDLTATSPDFKNAQFYPVASDKDEIFVRSILQKPGQNKKVPVLVAFDKKGKELRRYEGMEGSRKGFCVTDKYVIFIDPDGNFRVFEKKSGKKLGEGKITFGVFALATVKGNSIIAYDESAKKLYRIDF